jgi:hypothetical protein
VKYDATLRDVQLVRIVTANSAAVDVRNELVDVVSLDLGPLIEIGNVHFENIVKLDVS